MLHNSEKKPAENNLASAFLAAAKDIKARKAEEAAAQTEAAAGPAEDIEAGTVRPHDVGQAMVDNFHRCREGRGFIPIQVYEARYEESQRNEEEKAKKVEADILKAEKAKADRTQSEKEEDEAKLAEAIQNIDDFMGDLYEYDDDADSELAGCAAAAGPTLSFPSIERLQKEGCSRVLSPEEIRILAEHRVSKSSENLTEKEILARIEATFHMMANAQNNAVIELRGIPSYQLTEAEKLMVQEHRELYPEYYPDAAEQDDEISPEFKVMSEDEMRILAEKKVYDAVDGDKGRGVNTTQEEILVRIEETLQSMLDDQFNRVTLFYYIQNPTEAQERAMREHRELYPEEYELVEVDPNTGEYYPVEVDLNTGEDYSEGADAADVIEQDGVHCAGDVHSEETY